MKLGKFYRMKIKRKNMILIVFSVNNPIPNSIISKNLDILNIKAVENKIMISSFTNNITILKIVLSLMTLY